MQIAKWLIGYMLLFLVAAWMDAQTKTSKSAQPNTQYIHFDKDGAALIKTWNDGGNWFLGKTKPKNGQCPVCGWFDDRTCVSSDLKTLTPGRCAERENKLRRCARCNAAFWQDAEEVKSK